MHDDEDLVLNAKAIGLAVGGAAIAGLLFVLTRRDEQPAPVATIPAADEVAETFDRHAKKVAKAAKHQRDTVEAAAREHKEKLDEAVSNFDVDTTQRDLKAAAWDAQERAKAAEGKLRAATGKVAEDAAHIATRLAGEGRERIANLRRPDDASDEVERLKAELESLRAELAGKAKKERRDLLGGKKLGGKKGPLPDGVAGEAASAALLHLEKQLKAKAPLLLTARNKEQAMAILQRELAPTLRDTAMLALSTALTSASSAGQKAADAQESLKARIKSDAAPAADDLAEKLQAARDEAAAEASKRGDEAAAQARQAQEAAEAEAKSAREEVEKLRAELEAQLTEAKETVKANGKRGLWHVEQVTEATGDADREVVEPEVVAADEGGKRGVSGLLWGGAGLGLALYAMMDPERRENVLKLANEASVQLQELARDLQGYDDEF
ncbi:MAG: hypothetical protein QM692_01115 [Thermomicrobiales bacterium]